MSKKKQEKPEEWEIEPEDENFEEPEDIELDNTTIDNSLEIGGQIHIQDDIIKSNFKHLPKDVKYSRFGLMDIKIFTLKSHTYTLWNYLKKVQKVSKNEINNIQEERIKIYDIKTLEEFKKYLEKINKGYIWYSLQTLNPEDLKEKFKEIILQLQYAKENGIIEILYSDKLNFYKSYNSYIDNVKTSPYMDDFGLLNGMMTATELKKAHDGWAMKQMNTTISVTKEERLDEQQEEKPEQSETGFKRFMKK